MPRTPEMRPEREPAGCATERPTLQRLSEALPITPTHDMHAALQVALDTVSNLLDAAEGANPPAATSTSLAQGARQKPLDRPL